GWLQGKAAPDPWATRAVGTTASRRGKGDPRRPCPPLRLELLEDRSLLAPVILDPHLAVRPVVEIGPSAVTTTMAFLGDNDFFLLKKNTGEVLHVVDGAVQGTVLDLNVNFASERGLLGIALHPEFASNHQVYLYWTASAVGGDSGNLPDTP